MINLINGNLQNLAGLIVPRGSISFQLNTDANILAAPYGVVPAGLVVTFQFDDDGNLIPNPPASATQLWSNSELGPKTAEGMGTFYNVLLLDANGARIAGPMKWQFPNHAGDTVDISRMIALEVE